jgi:hypothetical protein
MSDARWPPLPLAEWEDTYLTLHRWTQVLGKVRLAHAPWVNHWWHVPLYVTSQGLTTSSMPCGPVSLTLTLDFCAHRFAAHASDGRSEVFSLEPMSVADFYDRVLGVLARLGIATRIWPVPVEVADATPFHEDHHHASYQRDAVGRLHRLLLSVDGVFATHRGRFLGKCSPVHFFWGAFDLAVTRFSGRPNPDPPRDLVMGEAYSHEVISHGFWPGGDWPIGGRMDQPIFYAYAVPEPAGFRDARVAPQEAAFAAELGEFVLPYDAVRTAPDPGGLLLEFMESTYRAAAKAAGWDLAALEHPAHPAAAPRPRP